MLFDRLSSENVSIFTGNSNVPLAEGFIFPNIFVLKHKI